MKTLKTFSASLALLLAGSALFAAPIAYSFRVTDSSGNLVPGATVQVGTTTLTAGSATTIPTAAGEKMLNTNAAPASAPSVTLLDYGTGDYSIVYDTTTAGELYLPLSISKSGSTFSGASALIALITPADPSNISLSATRVSLALPPAAPGTTGGLQVPIVSSGTSPGTNTGTTFVLATGASATTNLYNGNVLRIIGGTGMGQSRVVSAYNGSTLTATVLRPWTITPDATSVYSLVDDPHAVLDNNLAVTANSVTGNVTGNVTGSVGSISGITFPSNFGTFAVDSSGRVTLVPGGSGGIVTGYATGQDPASLLSGSFATVNSGVSGIPSAVLSRSIGHGMTVGQLLVLLQAGGGAAGVTNTWNATTHTLTTAYQFTGDSAPIRSDGTLYPVTQVTAPPVQSRTTTLGTIPQP